jgi:hypothetical protein
MSGASLARARSVDEMRALGKKAAEVIRAGGYQEKAALACGIHESTFYRWLDSDDEAAMAFSAEVKAAIFERAEVDEKKAESDIGSAESGSSAWAGWWKWKLSQRYRKLFGDLTQKVELTGKDGGPIHHKHEAVAAMSDAQLEAYLAKKEGE